MTDPTRANLWTLAFVAAWRVGLMVRVASVLTKRRFTTSLFMVMTFADAVVAALTFPRVGMAITMSGIRQSETDAVTDLAESCIFFLACITLPVFFICASLSPDVENPFWQIPKNSCENRSISRGMWILAVLSLLIWMPILPWTQREQELRYIVEKEMKAGRVDEALDLMSAHRQEEFPPQWKPPYLMDKDKKGSPHLRTSILEVMEHLATRDIAQWVRAAYLRIFRRHLEWSYFWVREDEEFARIVRILRLLPEGQTIAAEYVDREIRNGAVRDENDRRKLKHLLELVQRPDH
jgi:hypothetical protein